MDSVGPAPKAEDPPSPQLPGPIVNVIGTSIALLTLLLPTAVITQYSQMTLTLVSPVSSVSPSPAPIFDPIVVGRSPRRP